ncbi:hypothetical protein RDI58_022424 [Solanum bulbocastanum]|uniref:Uncharacterized protein n=1 Tax=Solanum bulbocastanum TaxID=147425 RepID=A0AAN8T417_SOLBU
MDGTVVAMVFLVPYYWAIRRGYITISQLMEVPMCSKSWRRTNEDQNLIKFGLIWKCYYMGKGWDISTTPRWLLCPYPNSFRDNEGDVMMALKLKLLQTERFSHSK